jgi:hypothetical protein
LPHRVVRSLYHRAVGYNYEAVKIFMPANREKPVYAPYIEHVPPDFTAAIFWSKIVIRSTGATASSSSMFWASTSSAISR